MSGNYIGNNPNGVDFILSDDYKNNNTKLFASTACVNNAVNEIKGAAFLPLGYFFLHPFPTPPDGCLVVNGGEYNRELYKDLFADAVRKNYVKPESEWQSIAAANNGYCPWYSSGDGSTTFRTPKFAPYQKITLTSGNAGKYYEAGLPGITGTFGEGYLDENNMPVTGAFGRKSGGTIRISGTDASSNVGTYTFDASKSNSIYGSSTTVQPELHDWIVCVVAFGTATNVGSVDVANVMSAVSQVQADVVTKLDGNTVHVVDSWKSTDGTLWYRKYSDGWIEQGGIYWKGSSVIGVNTVTFNTPFSNTLYNFYTYYLLGTDEGQDYIGANNYISRLTTATSFFIHGSFSGYNWYACGY